MISNPLCCLSFLLLFSATTHAEDWPRWRGPRADGTWNAPKLPEAFPEKGLETVWTQPIGGGYAGITTAEGRVFTMDLEEPIVPRKDGQPDGVERVRCFDHKTGKPLWSHGYPVKYGGLGGYNNGPRASSVFRDGKLYTLGAVGHFFCFDASSGKVHWSKDMVKEHKARVPEWGFAASPVIDGDNVLIHTGAEPDGSLIAFHRETGKEIWRSLPDPTGYCTPLIIEPKSGKQIVMWTPLNVRGLDAANGKLLWTVPYKVTYGVSIASPIFQENLVYVTGYWEGSKTIRLGEKPSDFELIHEEKREQRGLMAQPLYRDGYVYSFDRQLGLTCFELKTGKKIWDDENKLTPKARNPHASIVWIGDGDRILAVNAEGELVSARLNPKGYQELGRTKIIDGRVWGHPAFSGHDVIVRSDGGEKYGKGPFEIRCVRLVKD